jgi:hypothetical protein
MYLTRHDVVCIGLTLTENIAITRAFDYTLCVRTNYNIDRVGRRIYTLVDRAKTAVAEYIL